MDASRLLAAIEQLLRSYDELGIPARLAELASHGTNLMAAPTNEKYLSSFKAAKEAFDQMSSLFHDRGLSSGVEATLTRIGAAQLLPDALSISVESAINQVALSIQSVSKQLNEISSSVNSKIEILRNARGALIAIGVMPFAVPVNQCDVGIFIPSGVTKDDLDRVRDQIDKWNKVFKTALEIGTGTGGTVTVTGVESDSFDLHVSFDMEGAKAFLLIVFGVIGLIGLRAKYSLKRASLEKEGFDKSIIDAIRAQEDKLRGQETAKTTERVLASSHSSLDEPRKNELRTAVNNAVEFVIDSMDQGVRVEVLPPSASSQSSDGSTEETQTPTVSEIRSLASRVDVGLRRIERGEPLPPELTASPLETQNT